MSLLSVVNPDSLCVEGLMRFNRGKEVKLEGQVLRVASKDLSAEFLALKC